MSTATYHNPQENLHASTHHTDAGKYTHHERHRPEKTILYQLVPEHVETFFAQVEAEIGSGSPDFVRDEFDAFLECGVFAHGADGCSLGRSRYSQCTLRQRVLSLPITLIQRFSLVFDGVYHIQGDIPAFHGVRTPTAEQLQTLLDQTIQRILKALTRNGALIGRKSWSVPYFP